MPACGSSFARVQLHVHMDGSPRPQSLYEIAKERRMPIVERYNSVESFAKRCRIVEPGSLRSFLKGFTEFLVIVAGCKRAIQRTAIEFVQDCYNDCIRYAECRLSPESYTGSGPDALSIEDVVKCSLEAIREACESYENRINVGLILSITRTLPDNASIIVELAIKYRNEGVVGIDVSGDEMFSVEQNGTHPLIVDAFRRAKEHNLGRTVHAGESGPASMVQEAYEKMYAQRIGHGYHVLEDPEIYNTCLKKELHFETCPLSSRLTGAFISLDWLDHPLRTFLKDGASCSVSVDDALVFGNNLEQEYELCKHQLQLGSDAMALTNLYAAKATFLPQLEKQMLVEQLETVYELKFEALRESVLSSFATLK